MFVPAQQQSSKQMDDKVAHRSLTQFIPIDQYGLDTESRTCVSTLSARISPPSSWSVDDQVKIFALPQIKQSGSPGAQESVIVADRKLFQVDVEQIEGSIFTDLPTEHRNTEFLRFLECPLQQKIVTLDLLFEEELRHSVLKRR